MATLDLTKIGNTVSLQSPLQVATQPTALTSTNTKPTTAISVTPKPDNTNYAGILAGAQQQALSIQQQIQAINQPATPTSDKNPNPPMPGQSTSSPTTGGTDIKSYIDSIMGVQQPNAMQTYQQGYDASGLEQQKADLAAKAAVTTEAQGRLNNISAQLTALNTEAQAIPIQLQQDSTGRGITASGLAPIQEDALRANALKALPLQAQAAVIQAEVATAQGNQKLAQDLYTQAQDHFDKMFTLQMQDAQNKYEFQTNLIDKVYAIADKQEQRTLDAIKTQQAQDFQTKQSDIAYQRQLAMDKTNFQQQLTLQDLKNQPQPGETVTLSGKPQNATQSAANGYADRLNQSNIIIDNIGGDFTGAFDFGGSLPNALQSSDRQSFEQAKRNFVTAVLRRESGAAISDSEFKTEALKYFPQAGDKADTVLQKAAARNTAINNVYREAGVARPVLPGMIIESNGVRYRVASDGETLEKI